MTIGPAMMMQATDKDVAYSYLPLYHTSGVQFGISGAMFAGTRTIIKNRFSASLFWKDCVKYNVTVGISLALPIISDHSIYYTYIILTSCLKIIPLFLLGNTTYRYLNCLQKSK